MALIRGDLATAGVPELFRAIADERRTGSLKLSRPGDGNGTRPAEAAIFFRSGEAYTARLIGSGLRLGDRLISAGLVSKEDLEQALDIQRNEARSRKLGQVLLDSRVITQEQLSTIVRQQIEDTIFEILRWDGGEFQFRSDDETEEDIAIEISVENLVMEGARRFREWHQITRRVPTLEATPSFNEDEEGAVEVALTPEEWSFVSRVDGKHTIKELARSCGFTDLEAGRTVFGLVTAGLLTLELPSGVQLPPEDPDIEAAFDELERTLQEATRQTEGPSMRLEQLGRVEDEAEELEAPTVVETEAEPVQTAEASLLVPSEPEVFEQPSDVQGLQPSEPESRAWAPEPEPEIHLVEAGAELPQADLDETLGEVVQLVPPEREPEPEIAPAQPQPEPEIALAQPQPEPEIALAEPEPEPEIALAEPEPEPELMEPAAIEVPAVDQTDWQQALRQAEAESKAEEYAAPPVPELTPELEAEEVRWGVAASPSNGQAVPLEEPTPIQVISEEPPSPQATPEPTYARMFAELSTPIKDAETKQEPAYVSAPPPEPEPKVQPVEATEPRPVDPMVDTTALIREFSALGLEEEGFGGISEGDRGGQVKSTDDKGKGFFGRRKR